MFQFAILSDRSHQQFASTTGRVALRPSAVAETEWQLVDERDPHIDDAPLQFAVVDDCLRLERADNGIHVARPNDEPALPAGASVSLPCTLRVNDFWLGVAATGSARSLVQLNEASLGEVFAAQASGSQHAGPSASTVTRWLTDSAKLHRSSACSPEFYADAANFAINTVGLDGAWILRRVNNHRDRWQIVGSHLPQPHKGICFDPQVLAQLERRTVTWYQQADDFETLKHPQAVVVAPVIDASNELVGAVYAVRNISASNRRRGMRPLEARLVQLLADSVAVGIARQQQETEAARTRVLLEHAFSPSLAEYIQHHPESLAGQQREVSLMFADLRGYSRLAESLRLTDCYELLGDVMETLSQVVIQHGGVVVDYYGDGLLAQWNAPLDQPNHADLACQAALEMFQALDPVNERWSSKLDGPLELGIGIHSGPALVGNAGTRSRLKYGPRGNTVNVASRVQAATKQLQLPLVITAATQAKLTDRFFTLRVCTAKLPGLEQPAELFTAYPTAEAARVRTRLDEYAHALELFEAGELEASETLLAELSKLGPATPARFLADYAAAQKQSNQGRRAVDRLAAQHGSVIEILSK
ncbi:MAG: adenylate/guanylate cyclase domain-containing protein [Planctomycetota bacterium]